MKIYRYGCPMRPPSIGAVTKEGLTAVRAFDTPDEECHNCRWGWVEYNRPLTTQEITEYELIHLVTYDDEIQTWEE